MAQLRTRSAHSLTSLPTASLTAELARRERLLPGLQRRHAELVAEAGDLAGQIAALGGTANGPLRTRRSGHYFRRRGPGSLLRPDSIVHVLSDVVSGRTMSVTDAVAAVRKAGYRSEATAKSLYSAVAVALAQSGRFRRVARGRYTAKGAPGAPPSAPATSGKGTPARRRRGGVRGPRAGSVVSTLLQVLKGKTLTVTEAVAAVRKAGYKTKATAKSFYSVVAVALSRNGRFRRVARGKYTTK